MLNLSTVEWLDVPFPCGEIHNLVPPETYAAMVAAYPDEATTAFGLPLQSSGFNKRSLSVSSNPEEYARVLAAEPWASFNRYLWSDACLDALDTIFAPRGVRVTGHHGRWWEFSSIPAQGGTLMPHTDSASKLLSLVIWCMAPGSWDTEAWGGGMDVLLDGGRIAHTYPFRPNRALCFAKTLNSWHGVRPLHGPPDRYRRTLTVNVYA